MTELVLTSVRSGSDWDAYLNQEVIGRFSQQRRVPVKTITYGWDSIRKDLVNIGVYKTGADLSEVGSTWVPSLTSMNALRPFSLPEVARLGGESTFVPAAWQSTTMVGDSQVWAIPFWCDLHVIYYWRDMLEQVGVDEETAFQSPKQMCQTLDALREITPTPLAFQTERHELVYMAASWLWQAGADFISPDGKSVLLDRPEAFTGLKGFFDLFRYLWPIQGDLNHQWPIQGDLNSAHATVRELFFKRKVAAVVSGVWFSSDLWEWWMSGKLPDFVDQLGIASLPGPTFVGGFNLVVWNHSYMERRALDLIAELVSLPVQQELHRRSVLPARLDALNALSSSQWPFADVFIKSLKTGKSLPTMPSWGLIEQRLADTFRQIMRGVQSKADVDAVLSKQIPPLVNRLNSMLSE